MTHLISETAEGREAKVNGLLMPLPPLPTTKGADWKVLRAIWRKEAKLESEFGRGSDACLSTGSLWEDLTMLEEPVGDLTIL